MDTKKTSGKSRDSIKLLIIGLIMSIVVIGAWWANGIVSMNLVDKENRGAYGDMFGAVSALFSGLAFVGIIITILLQRQELSLQREELSHTREEIRGQKEQMELQNVTLRKQNFENTFFSLLKLQNEITAAIDLTRKDREIKGKDCFKTLYYIFAKRLKYEIDRGSENPIHSSYDDFYTDYHSEVAHYFQTLYNIFKFLESSNIEDKKFYTNLVRAQLSSFELIILFYNTLTPYGEKFKPLVEKYGLLKMLPKGLLLDPKHEDLHKPEVYGRT